VDKERIKQFQFRIFTDMSAALAGVLVHLGDRLGLFKALAGAAWMTSDELASASRLQPRYVREWLSAMAAREVVEYDALADRFRLPPEHAAVLADEASAVFTGAWFQTLPAFYRIAPDLARAFREGGGVPFADYGTDWLEGFARARRVVFRHFLVQKWLPLMDGMVARLQDGVAVADVGCGHGEALITLALAFPRSRFVGFDADDASLRLARANARAATVETRVEFRRQSVDQLDAKAEFDLAILFDCVHDLADPSRGLQQVGAALRPGGRVLIQELNVGETLADNLNTFGAFFYAISTLHCMTSSLARNGAGLGTAMPPSTLRRLVLDAGFASIERLPFTHPLYALYEVRL
jgi:2-polyprenyl-3-methyl-5-hydroxy-6-metoxy-1,4-benzoquinol methylase